MIRKLAICCSVAVVLVGQAHDVFAQSSSLLVSGGEQKQNADNTAAPKADARTQQKDPAADIHAMSLITIRPQIPRKWLLHDLVHIVIRETSTVKSSQEVATERDFSVKGEIKSFPQITLNDLADMVLKSSENANPAKVDVNGEKEFTGKGDYKRTDDFAARVTAEIIEIRPNGLLVLEARTRIQTDDEVSTILMSGTCDPDDVSKSGSVLSNDLFDLNIVKLHEGEVKKSTEKGLIARVLDTLFSF